MELRKEQDGKLKVRNIRLRTLSRAKRTSKGRRPRWTWQKKPPEAPETLQEGDTLFQEALSDLPLPLKQHWDSFPEGKKRRFLQAAMRTTAPALPLQPGSTKETSQAVPTPPGKGSWRSQGKRLPPRKTNPPALRIANANRMAYRFLADRQSRGKRIQKRFHTIPQTPRIQAIQTKGETCRRWGQTRNGVLPPLPAPTKKAWNPYPKTPERLLTWRALEKSWTSRGREGSWRGPKERDPNIGGKGRNTRNGTKSKRNQASKAKGGRTLLRLIEQDLKKEQQIRDARKEEVVCESQQTWETGTSTLKIALLPARLTLTNIKERTKTALLFHTVKLAKHAALAVLPLLIPLLLSLLLVALIGGLAGEEEKKDRYDAAYLASGYEIASYAKEWIGITKYVWGAGRDTETAWQKYADCSSFVHGVFSHFGIEIGGTTYAQENAGTLLDGGLAQAHPGDLILFYSGQTIPGNSSHVGIYLGEGQMVHCSGGSGNTYANPGRGVCIGSVEHDGRPYVIRRIVQSAYGGRDEFLSILSSYNTKLEADSEAGIKWWYTNRGTALTWNEANEKGPKATNCALLVRWALKDMGLLERDDFFYYTYGNTFRWTGNTEAHLRQNLEILEVRKTARQLIANGYLQPGDICCWHSMQHVNVYAGSNRWFDAGRGGTNGHWESFGHMDSGGWESTTYVFDGWGPLPTGYLDTQVDYILRLPQEGSSKEGTSGGNWVDRTDYTQAQMELIWAIVAQEDNGSYEGALAVISSAMNRTESPAWKSLGGNALSQLCAPGQYCYSNDRYWIPRLNGNVPDYVKQAVYDCLKKGIRNHGHTSFRSQKGSQTGPNAVQIGGNWYFGI